MKVGQPQCVTRCPGANGCTASFVLKLDRRNVSLENETKELVLTAVFRPFRSKSGLLLRDSATIVVTS